MKNCVMHEDIRAELHQFFIAFTIATAVLLLYMTEVLGVWQ